MNNFNAGTWFAEKVRYKQFDTVIDGIVFPLIPLTDEHIESIELAESYDEMIEIAVSNAMASDGVRLIDDSQLNEYYDAFWDEFDGEPSVKNQLGEYICEVSELSSTIDDAYAEKVEAARKLDEEKRAAEAKAHLESEEQANIIDGDSELDLNMTLGQLDADASTNAAA